MKTDKITRWLLWGGVTAWAVTLNLSAGMMAYAPATNIIYIQSFPEQAPATLDLLLAADQSNRWGVVSYDPAADTYRVQASLYIGGTNDQGTFMQIGRSDHPRETAVVKGDVWIKPPKKSLRKSDGSGFAIANRLTLGDPADTNIRATLKIDCSRPAEYGLYLGYRAKETVPGGDLYVFNSTLTAAIPDKDHRLRGFTFAKLTGWYAHDLVLKNAVISWIGDLVMYGIDSRNSRIEGTTFDHCGTLLVGPGLTARDCVFRSNQLAVGGSAFPPTLYRCVFEDNEVNWTATEARRGKASVTMIDCRVGPQTQPLKLPKSGIGLEEAVKRGVDPYPSGEELQSLLVKVTDKRGKPIPLAAVSVACPEDQKNVAVRNGYALTDAQGLTQADPESALLVARRRAQGTDDPTQPKIWSYAYVMTVKATGYRPYQGPINLGQDVPRPLVIKLE